MQPPIFPIRRASRPLPRPALSLALAFALLPVLVVAAALALCSPTPAGASELSDHTVQGISPRSTTINLFDYWLEERNANDVGANGLVDDGINVGHVLKFGKGLGQGNQPYVANTGNVNNWTMDAHPRTGIVEDKLGEDGYPVLAQSLRGGSLAYLFSPTVQSEGKESFSDVDGLIQIDSEGYYYFDCRKNYAAFDGLANSFVLYEEPGIDAAGSSGDGQFFPFTSADDVFEVVDGKLSVKEDPYSTSGKTNKVNSLSACANHYFGLTMSTRFIQQNGGVTADGTPITYNFSGDDDVWIFIDGHLVGDLGGNHNTSSIEIDFSTGEVTVFWDKNDNNKFDEGDQKYDDVSTTLKDACGLQGKTFADNTYHTLDFFYLERGNTDSNLSLRYNLATYPASTIQKVDQDGTGLEGVTFDVTNEDGEQICTATTDATGAVELLDEYGEHVSLQEIYDQNGAAVQALTFKEKEAPTGYRSAGEFAMNLVGYETIQGNTAVVLLADDMWEKGAHAASGVTSTLSMNEKLELEGDEEIRKDNSGKIDGTLFVVIEKNVGTKDEPNWRPVYGDPVSGWHLADADTSGVLEAARATNAVFRLTNSGYEATVDVLPGNVYDFKFFDKDQGGGVTRGDGSLRGSYYYTTADSLADATADNIHLVKNSQEAFGRVFSAHVYIPNVLNRFIVQKVDDWGRPVNGATMALYGDGAVEVVEGTPRLKDGFDPIDTVTTDTLTEAGDGIDLEGAGIFSHLSEGVYWVGELVAPEGYAPTDALAKVLVRSDGVFADAGDVDDGVTVMRGVGKLVRSMIQFATNDDIDATLHDLVATPMTLEGDQWEPVAGGETLHLTYADEGTSDAVLDYVASDEGGHASVMVDEGVPGLKVQQCNATTTSGGAVHAADPRQDIGDTDVTALFGGTTVVRLENERESLTVTKVLENADVKGAPSADTEYTVQIALTFGEDVDAPSTVRASVQNADGTGERSYIVLSLEQGTDGGHKVTHQIKAGQTLSLYGLPNETAYEVSENTAEGSLLAGVTLEEITGGDGTIDASDTTADAVTVTNLYEAKGSLELTAKKELLNGAMEADDFTFSVYDSNNEEVATGSNSADGTITFGPIEYTLTKLMADSTGDDATASYDPDDESYTYVYMVREDDQDLPEGCVPIQAVERIVVTVTNNGTQKLDVSCAASRNGLVFVNSYGEEGRAYVSLAGIKVLDVTGGATPPDINGRFTFDLTGVDVADESVPAPMPLDDAGNKVTTVTCDTAGNVDFGMITYTMESVFGEAPVGDGASDRTRERTFRYTVTERPTDSTSLPGVTNDPQVSRTFTVKVTDNGDGTLTATCADANGNELTSDALFSFTNSFDPTVSSAPAAVSKELEGRPLVAGEFEFVMLDEKNQEVARGTNDADGKVTFDGIRFTTPGSYRYTIREVDEGAEGVTYDKAVYHATATVEQGEGFALLDVTWTLSAVEGGESLAVVTFENTYEKGGGSGGGGGDPEPDPGTDPEPGTDPDPEPGTEPDPGIDPEPEPGDDPEPGDEPDPDPGTDPDPEPGTDPGPEPGTDPEPEPGTDPEPGPGSSSDPESGPGTRPKPGDSTSTSASPDHESDAAMVPDAGEPIPVALLACAGLGVAAVSIAVLLGRRS